MLCYSLVFSDSYDCAERLRSLSDIPLELVLGIDDLRNLGMIDIAEPLSEVEARVVAVKIAEGIGNATEEDLEKILVIADGVSADYTVIPVSEEGFENAIGSLNQLFRSAAIYAKKVVLEPSREVLPRLSPRLSEFLGGVFKYSISPTPRFTTDQLLKLSLAYFGQLAAVKLVCFTRDGRATRIAGAAGLNVFVVIKELIERGYDGLFVLDYEPRGLFLPPRLVKDDYNLLQQFVRSMVEKSR